MSEEPTDTASHTSSDGPRKRVIYTRQSRGRSVTYSSSESQLAICADMAHQHGWTISEERFDDQDKSSETLDRPAMQRLLQQVEVGNVGHIIVYSVDRLTRRLFDLAELLDLFERQGVTLTVVTDPRFGETAASRLTSNIVAAAAEFQQEITRERMADARAALKSEGRRVAGRVAFGYASDPRTKQLVVKPVEAEVVREVFQLAGRGLSAREIAETPEIQHLSSRAGRSRHWTPRQILKMLSNPTYAGLIRDGENTRPGQHEPIVTEETFDRVQKCIASRRSRTPGRSTSPIAWPLKGVLRCGQCGRLMSPSVSGYKNLGYRYYRCRSHAGGRPPCPGVSLPAFEVEEYVRSMLVTHLINSDSTQAHMEPLNDWANLDSHQQRAALGRMVKEICFDPIAETISLTTHELFPETPGDDIPRRSTD